MNLAIKIRNVLLKCFLMSFLLLILSSAIYYFSGEFIFKLCQDVYQVPPVVCRVMILEFYAYVKLLAIFGFLVPALAIHCEFVAKCCCKKSCDVDKKEDN